MNEQTNGETKTKRKSGGNRWPAKCLPPASQQEVSHRCPRGNGYFFGALRVRQNHSASANLQNQQNKGVGGWGWERVFRYWVFFQRGVSSAARYTQPTVRFNNNPMNVSATPPRRAWSRQSPRGFAVPRLRRPPAANASGAEGGKTPSRGSQRREHPESHSPPVAGRAELAPGGFCWPLLKARPRCHSEPTLQRFRA